MNRQRNNRRSFERLETREMMAGNVAAVVTDGTLTITGDNKANTVVMQEIGDTGQWKITMGAGTWSTSAQKKIITDTVTGDIVIDLQGGADKLTIKNGTVPGALRILMGDGNDSASLANLQIGTYLHFEGGAGSDQLSVSNVHVTDPTFAYFSSIDMQNGNDKANINQLFDQDLQLTMGAGNDQLSMTNSDFVGGPYQRLMVDSGDGNDAVKMTGDVTGPLSVDVGTGKNTLKVSGCTADTASLLNEGTGSLAGSGNNFGSDTVGAGFTQLTGQFNI